MARYEHLPIYKAAMDLCVYLEQTVRKFSRYNKYTLGQELRDLSRAILLLIIRANSTLDREQILQELTNSCEMLKVMLVLAKEVRAFESFKSFQHASSMAVILSKQSEGWLKSSRRSRNRQSPPKG